MKIFNKFIWSKKEPSNKNDIWFDGSTWRMYTEEAWQSFTLPVDAADKVAKVLENASEVYQEKLNAGYGIVIEGNTISLDVSSIDINTTYNIGSIQLFDDIISSQNTYYLTTEDIEAIKGGKLITTTYGDITIPAFGVSGGGTIIHMYFYVESKLYNIGIVDDGVTPCIFPYFCNKTDILLYRDDFLSEISENSVQNKVITAELNKKLNKTDVATINGQSLTEGGNIVIPTGGESYDDTEIKQQITELSASLGKYEGLKTRGSVIFTAAEVPHGNIIYVSFSNINTAGNILVKNAEGTILHRFENEGGKGSSFVGESYLLPSDYDKIEVGSYGSVNLSIEVSSYSFDFINGKIKDLEGYNIEQDSKINGLEQNLEMENIADFVSLEPISIEEGKFVYSSGAESPSSLQNIANYDVADLAGTDLVIKAWVSTNSVVGYYFVLDNGGQQGGSFYDKGGIVTEHVIRVPANAKTLRFSYYKEGSISAKYRPSISLKEYVVMTANKVGIASSLAGSNALVASTDVLANEIFTMEGAPTYTKKDCVMSFKANIASFNSISFGMGYDTIRGLQVIVDANTITFKAAGAARFTESHGLTIGTYLRCSVYHELKTFKFVISTLSGTYYKEYEMSWLPDSETYGIPYIYADNGTELRNVKLSRGGADFKKPVWIFGDSYLSFQSMRWIYYILEYGFHNFMLCGLAGANSAQMYEQLECCLKLGMPKYIVWCLGMNDGVNATPYKTYYEKVREICEKNGIELILQTIPNVPNADKSAINAIIKNSGLRYIDAADAVGSYETANWYDGFLEDGVHPSELGAQAIAAQVLADFPEIMQY